MPPSEPALYFSKSSATLSFSGSPFGAACSRECSIHSTTQQRNTRVVSGGACTLTGVARLPLRIMEARAASRSLIHLQGYTAVSIRLITDKRWGSLGKLSKRLLLKVAA